MSLQWLVLEFKKDWKKLPNLITLSRLALGVFPAIFLIIGTRVSYAIALALFVALICTDWIDGLVARSLDLKTEIGRYLDPIADRFILGLVIIVLIIQNIASRPLLAGLFTWLMLAAVCILLMLYRASFLYGIEVKPNISGKVKTVFLGFLIAFVISENIDIPSFLLAIMPNLPSFLSVIMPYFATMTLVASAYSLLEYGFDYIKIKDNRLRGGLMRVSSEMSACIMLISVIVVSCVIGLSKVSLAFWLFGIHYWYIVIAFATIILILSIEELVVTFKARRLV